jgi:drug/metabolite transporter (DMT)-like permease
LKPPPSHLVAVLQALFVTFLWSTSWVLIKIGLKDIPALTFAGLRYSLAFLCLLPFLLRPASLAAMRGLSGRAWARLIVLGLLFYAITQGAQFLGLFYLRPATVNLVLSFTPALVALLGIAWLAEQLTALQWAGAGLSLVGVVIYFFPVSLAAGEVIGLAVVAAGVLANAGSSILGRHVNRSGDIQPLVVTGVSMGIGAGALLAAGVGVQGLPRLSPLNWAIVGWLAVVNTALAFTLWNHTLRTLPAVESSIINNTMLIQIAILAWIFLGDWLSGQEIAGLVLALAGTLIVQTARQKKVEGAS